MRVVPVILFGLAYLLNSVILERIYPNVSKDYYEYFEFIATRNKVYEAMFSVLLFALYLNTKGLLKAIACGILILTTSSFIDKTVFNITQYLYSDIAIVVLSVILSIYVYVRQAERVT